MHRGFERNLEFMGSKICRRAAIMFVMVHTENVTLQVADGSSMNAYVAAPSDGGSLPGLLVFQEAFGVNGHIRDVTRRFAEVGFVAIAPEMFHRTAPGFEGAYDNFPAIVPHMQALTPAGMVQDAQAAFDWLQKNSRVLPKRTASVGFCMGGRVSFLANSALPLQAAISFYGGGIAPALLTRTAELHAPMLFFWGGLDSHIPQDQIQAVTGALRNAKKTFVNVEISDADHGFFCDARPSYNQAAANQAWSLSLKFLETYLH
jgi:carboxymethylenebutenolidase